MVIPGEKLARFSSNKEKIGNINRNSPFGIFGKLNQDFKNGINDKPLPITLSHEVKEGPAKILTVVDGSRSRGIRCGNRQFHTTEVSCN